MGIPVYWSLAPSLSPKSPLKPTLKQTRPTTSSIRRPMSTNRPTYSEILRREHRDDVSVTSFVPQRQRPHTRGVSPPVSLRELQRQHVVMSGGLSSELNEDRHSLTRRPRTVRVPGIDISRAQPIPVTESGSGSWESRNLDLGGAWIGLERQRMSMELGESPEMSTEPYVLQSPEPIPLYQVDYSSDESSTQEWYPNVPVLEEDYDEGYASGEHDGGHLGPAEYLRLWAENNVEDREG